MHKEIGTTSLSSWHTACANKGNVCAVKKKTDSLWPYQALHCIAFSGNISFLHLYNLTIKEVNLVFVLWKRI